jgi:hypothetical protein
LPEGPPIAVRRADPLRDGPGWDAGLAGFPGATIFHTAAWARVLHHSYGFSPAYFTACSGDSPGALLPVLESDSWLTGRRGISMPFTDECAPLSADPECFQALYREALRTARVRRWKFLELRGGRALLGDVPPCASFLGHRLDLRKGEAALLAGLEKSTRGAVRKAGQAGLTVTFSRDLEAVRSFHALLVKTRKRHGVPPQPFRFFEEIHRHILSPGRGWVALARSGDVPVAGAVYFHHGPTVTYKYGASDSAFNHLSGNNLVTWESIRRHAAEGFATFDFGRTPLDNAGLRKFKMGWGPAEHRIEYVRHDRRSGRYAADSGAGPRWRGRLLRALPEPLLKLIGSVLYRHAA